MFASLYLILKQESFLPCFSSVVVVIHICENHRGNVGAKEKARAQVRTTTNYFTSPTNRQGHNAKGVTDSGLRPLVAGKKWPVALCKG
jgi:hypothetical protein